ncbi:carboxylesterase/lipase family protein [Glycomyces buryatensis]|uniref:Carboxylic ester hydrolase n=1 Tax=Glycomyces buryatensis TaxID=2570927 RepID=A0A4S8QA98_9ACTN|nr:carboxylesterase family protein [Glycomyces buryatensis]THV41190.1 carboxylesterase family protein [Glycomyces buryatensis]
MQLKTSAKRAASILAASAIAAGAVACGTAQADAVDAETTTHSGSTLVTTESGQLQGAASKGVRSWLGVPYAAPPVDDLRWVPTEDAESWEGVREATEFGSPCAQGTSAMGMPGIPGTDEDCLYLNVYAPETGAEDLPVMVWLHGGGNTYGAAEQYDPSRLVADGDVVVVTVNYRLGLFGSLAHPVLDGEDGETLSGNYGLQDQQAAFEWVRSEAAAFGGDSGNVTLFGESGGGYDVCAHLASAGSAGLFDKAIMQSANCATDWATTRADGQATAAAVAEALCEDVPEVDLAVCLRDADPADLNAQGDQFMELQPVIGGPVMPIATGEALTSGEFNHVPVLHGVTSDEFQPLALSMEIESEADYLAALEANFGDQAEAIAAEYPASDFDLPVKAMGRVLSDAEWATGFAQTRVALGDQVPAFSYEMSVADAPYYNYVPRPDFPVDAFHMVDCAFLFDTPFMEPLSEKHEPLADLMIESWSTFARTGDPDGDGGWEPHSTDTDTRRLSPEGATNVDFEDDHHTEFWASLHA